MFWNQCPWLHHAETLPQTTKLCTQKGGVLWYINYVTEQNQKPAPNNESPFSKGGKTLGAELKGWSSGGSLALKLLALGATEAVLRLRAPGKAPRVQREGAFLTLS